MFLREQSLPLPLAQRVAERHGPQTVARIQQDPYVALAGVGLPFRWADRFVLCCAESRCGERLTVMMQHAPGWLPRHVSRHGSWNPVQSLQSQSTVPSC